jgi:hypothetical protein
MATLPMERTRRGAWLRRLLFALCCGVPCAGWAAGASCGASVRFAWVPAAAGAQSGRVDVVDVRSGRTVQRIDAGENYYAGDPDGGLAAQDLNNDGCADLVVTNGVAPIGNRSVTVYLYDRARHRFVANDALSAIGDPSVDDLDRNCVTGSWKGGAEDVYSSRHCWRGGRLVLVSEYSLSPLYDKETGEFACYEQVETTYVGKKKRVRRTCTKTY